MSLQSDFITFVSNISNLDFEDIDTKYKGITKKLNSHYYESDSETDNSKKVGSIGRGTAIKGISDLDMLYEIPEERFNDFKNYESNGPSQLLQEVKNILLEKYSRTDIKGDGQVVVVDFDSQHVEVVPCHKISNYTYEYPDTHNGGTWKTTSPDLDIQKIKETNDSYPVLIPLCKMTRAWKNHYGVNLSGILIDILAYNFITANIYKVADYKSNYFQLVLDFFKYLTDLNDDEINYYTPGSGERIEKKSKIHKKANKAYQKLSKMKEDDSYHLRDIFGNEFPSNQTIQEGREDFSKSLLSFRNTEEFIEDKYPVNIKYDLDIEGRVYQDGFRPQLLSVLKVLRNRKKIEFFINSTSVPKPYRVFWKVRNVGPQAEKRDCIRGQIEESKFETKTEPISFDGPHFVECYIIKDGVCVARDRVDVPIKLDSVY